METYLGKKGLSKTWQEDFPETIKCHKCKGTARIMFVVQEGFEKGVKREYVCNIHDNMKDKKYWPHDCIACAVYLCEKCFEPNALINQA